MSAQVKGPASYFPSIEKKYGRPVAEWKDLIRSSPLTRHMELVTWLKTEHGLGHGHANALVAHTLAEGTAPGPSRAGLRVPAGRPRSRRRGGRVGGARLGSAAWPRVRAT